MSGLVITSTDHEIATVELNRPSRRNALSVDLVQELVTTATDLAADGSVKVLILRGGGPDFCAGADLTTTADLANKSAASQVAAHHRMQSLFEQFERVPLVKIAQIHGSCVGAGLVLASLCELRVATATARFRVPELAFGIPFSMAGLPRLVRTVGPTRAADLVLTGRWMHAAEALTSGLVTSLADEATIRDVTSAWADSVSGYSPFLITNAVTRLREAAESLAPTTRHDLDSLVLASLDPESVAISQRYAAGITQRTVTRD